MVRWVRTSRDSVLCARVLLLLHAVLSETLIFLVILAKFLFACLAECFRLSWSNDNKKYE